MASLSRGYHFASDELVTASKLHQLVESADLFGISLDDFGSGAAAIQATKPDASPAEGNGWYEREVHEYTVSQPSNSARYSIQVMSMFGQVALINPYALETRRIAAGSDAAAFRIGQAVLPETGGGVTLHGWGLSGVNALLPFSAVAEASVAANTFARAFLYGLAHPAVESFARHATLPNYLYLNPVGPGWNGELTATSGTNPKGHYGPLLANFDAAAGIKVLPAWITGPQWQT